MPEDTPKVLHLITRLLRGGAEAKTLATVYGLQDRYDFTVGYGSEYDSSQVAGLRERGVETKRFPLMRHYNPVTAVPAVLSIARYVRKNDFDVVHTHSTEAGIIGRLAARLAGSPVVVHTVHGVPFSDDRSAILNRFVLECERWVAPRTDAIVTNADAIADDYLSRGIGEESQYTTIYSGIDVDAFGEAEPVDLPGSGVQVLMVARLARGKGFEVLFDAVEELGDRDGFSVHVVGDGPLYDELLGEVERRGLKDRVYLHGYRDDVPGVMAASDVFVLPSFREGTPRVITEALASGLPVVATDIAGIPEQVEDGENGFLIEGGRPDQLADALRELLDDPELRRGMGDESRGRVGKFSEEKMVGDLDELYSGLLRGNR